MKKRKYGYNLKTEADIEAEMKQAVKRQLRKEERIENTIDFFKVVTFTPLSMFLRVVTWIAKTLGTFSILGIFLGLYNGWKFFSQYKHFMMIGDFGLLKSCIGFCVLPVVFFFIMYGAELIANYLESEI